MNGCRGGRWVLGVAHSSPALPPTVVPVRVCVCVCVCVCPALPPTVVPVRDFCSLLVVKYDTWTDH